MAGGSKDAGVLLEDAMDFNQDGEIGPGALDGQDVNIIVRLMSNFMYFYFDIYILA